MRPVMRRRPQLPRLPPCARLSPQPQSRSETPVLCWGPLAARRRELPAGAFCALSRGRILRPAALLRPDRRLGGPPQWQHRVRARQEALPFAWGAAATAEVFSMWPPLRLASARCGLRQNTSGPTGALPLRCATPCPGPRARLRRPPQQLHRIFAWERFRSPGACRTRTRSTATTASTSDIPVACQPPLSEGRLTDTCAGARPQWLRRSCPRLGRRLCSAGRAAGAKRLPGPAEPGLRDAVAHTACCTPCHRPSSGSPLSRSVCRAPSASPGLSLPRLVTACGEAAESVPRHRHKESAEALMCGPAQATMVVPKRHELKWQRTGADKKVHNCEDCQWPVRRTMSTVSSNARKQTEIHNRRRVILGS